MPVSAGVKWRQGDTAMPTYLDDAFWDEIDAEIEDDVFIEFL